MMIPTIAAALAAVVTVPPQSQVAHICWVDRVEIEESGVRVFFTDHALVRPDERSVRLELGGTFWVGNSGHDSCIITVARKNAKLGVQAEANFFAAGMTKPEVRTEWIAAALAL